MKRRSVTAAIASVALGLSVALLPAASASAAANGSISVYNSCGQRASFYVYQSGRVVGGGNLTAGASIGISLAPGTYVVSTSPRSTTVTIRSGYGVLLRLCG